MSFESKNDQVMGRQLKVQRLVIPFDITASATPSAVVLHCDEPSFMFIKSEGVDQITPNLASGEVATYSVSPSDASGICNIFIRLQPEEKCLKVLRMGVMKRSTGAVEVCKLGDADGISSLGNIMLTVDSAVNFATTDYDGCIDVEYVVDESV
jgi:hypothetical protein